MKLVRRASKTSLVAGIVLGLGGVWTVNAWADHFDNLVPYIPPGAQEPASIKQTDNSNVSYYMDSNGAFELEQEDKQIVNSMLDLRYRPTDLAFSYDSSPTFSGSGETDTIWQEGAVSGSAEGRTWCDDPVGEFRCDQHYIRIEGGGSYTLSLTCHEMGHAVGLTHGSDAAPSVSDTNSNLHCMKTPTGGTSTLGAHNRNQINAVY